MGRLSDHYSNGDVYPATPGWKEPGTSRDAAAIAGRTSENLRALVLAALVESGPHGLTSDQVAAKLNISVLSARPRVTELLRMGKIERTGERRLNASRTAAAVLRAR